MLVTHNSMEILFTPGRVTMLGESDGNRLRRIYTDGRLHPEDPDPTYMGNSTGYWDGDTLVVDTIGLDDHAEITEGVYSGNNHLIERIRLSAPDTLDLETTIINDELLSEPFVSKRQYRRHREWDLMEYNCQQNNKDGADPFGRPMMSLEKKK